MRRIVLVLFSCVISVCSLAGCSTASKAAPAPPPPPQVSIVTVAPERVALPREWITTLDGYVNAQIRPQVSGYLVRQSFTEGAHVSKGQVLFEIDPRPFQAVLDQAEARVAEAEAQLGKAERDLARDRPLAEQRAIAQSQLENDVQAQLAATAALKSAQAAVQTAQLNLAFTRVTSLVDGVAAIATAQIGDLVGPQTLLTTVSKIDPIKAYFPLSEQEYLQIAGTINQRGHRQPFGSPLTLILADGSTYPHAGAFLAADREIDPKTGTIRIGATFPNPQQLLRPGQYGRVRVDMQVVPNALLVPQRAVTELQGTYQVRTIDAANRVSTHAVHVGSRIGNRWVIEQGLTAGDRVVVEGATTRDGMTVKVTPFETTREAE